MPLPLNCREESVWIVKSNQLILIVSYSFHIFQRPPPQDNAHHGKSLKSIGQKHIFSKSVLDPFGRQVEISPEAKTAENRSERPATRRGRRRRKKRRRKGGAMGIRQREVQASLLISGLRVGEVMWRYERSGKRGPEAGRRFASVRTVGKSSGGDDVRSEPLGGDFRGLFSHFGLPVRTTGGHLSELRRNRKSSENFSYLRSFNSTSFNSDSLYLAPPHLASSISTSFNLSSSNLTHFNLTPLI